MNNEIKQIVAQMTLEEKAAICSGESFWETKKVERLGIASIIMSDGPHGIRKQVQSADHMGLNESVAATCFPAAATTASSWNPGMLKRAGEAIGEEALQEEVAIVLGPGTNIKRSPLCGRNFEYFSEDPYLAGEMAAAMIEGIQSKGIGTSLKHFAANSQEKARITSNSVVDERALREIYLQPFEKAVKKARPWTMMCSYNRINGEYSCENQWLLDDVLRQEWGFEGLVMTDWGAMDDRVKALEAGLELEMPGPNKTNDQKIIDAVQSGILKEEILNRAVERLITLLLHAAKTERKAYEIQAHHRMAREFAAESMILLKNGGMLPLCREKQYAVIGGFVEKPRYQGAGSSKINPHKIDSVKEELENAGIDFVYRKGYEVENMEPDFELIEEAKKLAASKDGAIIFIGLPDSLESEGFDRTTLELPESHNVLIDAITEVNPHVTVVLMCGSVVLMPWRNKVDSIVLAYLGGEAAGGACADVLTGKVNPSGKLAETFPVCLEDTPAYGNFASEKLDVEYKESIFVGYRYYDWAEKRVAYPFGHGLSYTTFSYDNLQIDWNSREKRGNVKVRVTNTGNVAGSEIVQMYIGKKDSKIMRAPKELKGFRKIFLKAGESKVAEMPLEERSFSYYNIKEHMWSVEQGIYQVYAGASSRDLRLSGELEIEGDKAEDVPGYEKENVLKDGKLVVTEEEFGQLFDGRIPLMEKSKKWTVNTSWKETLQDEKGRKLFGDLIHIYINQYDENDDIGRMMLAMAQDMPLRNLATFGMTELSKVEELLEEWNR